MTKSNKKPLTNKERLEREYNKQIRRIERRKKEMEQLGYVVNIVCISVYRHTLDEIYRLLEYALSDHDLIF